MNANANESPVPSGAAPRATRGYTRVSTDSQADSGLGLDAQRERITAMGAAHGLHLDEIIEDAGHSAKNLERPGVTRLIAEVRAGNVGTVIIHKLDRLTRSLRDLAELLDLFCIYDVSLISVEESIDTGTATGRMLMNLITTVSQWEREVIGERTKAALQVKRARGERVGTVPLGWRVAPDGVTLEPNIAEVAMAARARMWRAAGMSLDAIAERISSEGTLTRTGKTWRKQGIFRLLNILPPHTQ